MTAKIAWYEGELWAATPYKESFIDAFKREIPHEYRCWEKGHKMWRVSPEYAFEVQNLLTFYYGGFQTVRPAELGLEPEAGHRRAAPAPEQQKRSPYEVLHLRESAPPELVRAAYKCLALLHHPDKGGSLADMQAINGAYEVLQSDK